MASTYDPTKIATSPMDYVRFLIGDTDTPNTELSDEEIEQMLTLYPVPACAAYRLLDGIIAKENTRGQTSGPIASKSVDGLSVTYATASKGQTRGDQLTRLKEECARRSQRKSLFEVVRT